MNKETSTKKGSNVMKNRSYRNPFAHFAILAPLFGSLMAGTTALGQGTNRIHSATNLMGMGSSSGTISAP